MTGTSLREAELEGWDRKASYWDDSLGSVTLVAIHRLIGSGRGRIWRARFGHCLSASAR